MACEERDPGHLKLHVLLLLLDHPQGLGLGDFSGAFHQLHGYHPHISLYGYRSLKELVADMKGLVVVEGSSQRPLMKLVDGLALDRWLEGEENGPQSSRGEPWCLTKGEQAEEQSVGLGVVLATLTNLLTEYKLGLKIKKLQEFVLARDGVDLEKFSISQGHKDTLEFLEARMPEINIQYQESSLKCLVQLPADGSVPSASSNIQNSVREPAGQAPALSDILEAVTNLVAKYKSGIKIKKLQELLLVKDGVNLEKFSISQGYKDTLEFVEARLPELKICYQQSRVSCVVQLPEDGLFDILAAVTKLVAKYKLGLKIKKLQEFLLAGDGIDLEKLSTSQGYKDTLEFLEVRMPELNIQYQENRLNCVVQLPAGLSNILEAVTNLVAKYKLGLKIKTLQELLQAGDGINLERFCIGQGYKDTLEFLEARMPELNIRYQENRLNSVVQLPAVPCNPVTSVESDVSASNSDTAPSSLTRPGQKSGTSSPAPCSTVFSACNSEHGVPHKATEENSDGSASSVADSIQNCVEPARSHLPELSVAFFLIRGVLEGQPHGLKLKKLKKALNENYKFSLETFSTGLGYKDGMSCLQDISGLLLRNVTKPRNCVVQLESRDLSPAPSLDSDFSACSSDTTLSGRMRQELGIHSSVPSLDSDFSACSSDTPHTGQTRQEFVGLAHVSLAVHNLLANYQWGLRIEKLQELMLATDGIDLEKVSISQGYKDALEFLEAKMPEINIQHREDRERSLLQFTPGNGETPKQKWKRARPRKRKSQDQSLPVPPASVSPAVENGLHASMSAPQPPAFSSLEKLPSPSHSSSSPQLLCPSPGQPSRVGPLNGTSPADQPPFLLDAELPRASDGTKDQPSEDLEEVKQQVARILAAHPKGMSLFQFRAAYSAAYQQHLPLGNASSVSQRLLEMPDVVRLEGCGVQTLLLPVSSSASPVKPGQPGPSTVEETSTLPGPTLPSTPPMAEPAVTLKPAPLSKAIEVPQHRPISSPAPELNRGPDNRESCILPGSQPPAAPKIANPWQEHQKATANADNMSDQWDLSRAEKAIVDLATSLPIAGLGATPKPCLKPPSQKAASVPKPQPRVSLLQSSKRCGQNKGKESPSFSEPVLQEASLPTDPMQDYVRLGPRPACVPFPPQSPVVLLAAPKSMRLAEHPPPRGLVPEPMPVTNPWSLGSSAPVTFVPPPVSASVQAWAQPIVYPPVTVLSEVPALPGFYPASRPMNPVAPSQIHFPTVTLQGHLPGQTATPWKLPQGTPPTRSAPQRSSVQAAPPSGTIFQVQTPSRTLPPAVGSRSTQSQDVNQPVSSERCLQDCAQGVSLPMADEKLPGTTLEVASEPSSSTHPTQHSGAVSLVSSSDALPFGSRSPTSASLQTSGIEKNVTSPSGPPAFMNRPPSTSRSTATASSDDTRPGRSQPPSDPTPSPCGQSLHRSSSLPNNSGALFSEPQPSIHRPPQTSVSSAGTMSSTRPLGSPSVDSTTSSSHDRFSDSWRDGVDRDGFGPRNVVFNQTGGSSVSSSREQTPYNSPPGSPLLETVAEKCVIL